MRLRKNGTAPYIANLWISDRGELVSDTGRQQQRWPPYTLFGQTVRYARHGLYRALYQLVKTGCRDISGLESPELLQDAVFYNDVLDYTQTNQPQERKAIRAQWNESAQKRLDDCEIVFLDPDNGSEVSSTKPYNTKGNKYVTYQEAAQYYADGKSVLIYNHRDRSTEEKYIDRFRRFYSISATKDAYLLCLTFRRVSVRDYVLLSQTEHFNRIKAAMDYLFGSPWASYFAYRAV